MQVLYSGPRDELRWNGILFRRNEIKEVESEKDARRLAAFDGFVIIPETERRGPGRPRKVA